MQRAPQKRYASVWRTVGADKIRLYLTCSTTTEWLNDTVSVDQESLGLTCVVCRSVRVGPKAQLLHGRAHMCNV